MDEEEKKFKEEALKLLVKGDLIVSGSEEELDWLANCEKLILRHRLFEIIRGEAI